ncbi:hypothetical protein [Streptomyces sp. NBC_00233]|uniref:hypothetical protein n=1 Tax=Streptomyces sp. NBC_00233 TaxID=2975686 RepID=UPI00225ABAB2|nr:hypothetical protein [Streptomyces sp. NBC_00233]MCX5233518.1 hypothetical protein [Streptomyces sp. NBC_00233]
MELVTISRTPRLCRPDSMNTCATRSAGSHEQQLVSTCMTHRIAGADTCLHGRSDVPPEHVVENAAVQDKVDLHWVDAALPEQFLHYKEAEIR